jgi:gamma-glutamyltranspeptidase / glutathione hydrolase
MRTVWSAGIREPVSSAAGSIRSGGCSSLEHTSCASAVLNLILWIMVQATALGEPVHASRGMVVSAQRRASEVGVRVLQEGGNAVDAAIATGLALAVVHPSAGNLGGGGFMLVMTKHGEATAFDFREKAPAQARPDMYLDASGSYLPNSNHEGYRAVGVPGTVAGFDLALKRFGTRSWNQLAAPAGQLAEEGFPLGESMARNSASSAETGGKTRPPRRCS